MHAWEFPARDLVTHVRAGKLSAVEATRSALDRIGATEGAIHAFIDVLENEALHEARAIDNLATEEKCEKPLCGVPVAIKDVICTATGRTTCGSRALAAFRSPYEASVVQRLRDAGAVVVGKTNTDEFAMGSSTETSCFGPTRNPWNTSCVPGGSSGGSAAAVAACMVPGALGSDTGGSVRQPASFCGVVGLKPTYGRVSRYGLVAFASSLEQIGPLTRDAWDCALLFSAMAGYEPEDSTSAPQPAPSLAACLNRGLAGLRVGLPEEYMGHGTEPSVADALTRALMTMEELGAVIEETSLPHTDYALAAYYLVAPAEASSNLARYDGARYGYRTPEADDILAMYQATRGEAFGAEVRRRIILGTYALSAGYYEAFYLKAKKVQTLIRRDFDRAFQRFDVLAAPTSPVPAFRLGERLDVPLQMYLADVCTVPANLAGIPAISIPCGFSGEGLPVGLQLMAPHFREDLLLGAAHAFQQATGFHKRKPPL